jgi:hypothetical protein
MMSDEKLDCLLHELKEENAQILPPPFISTRLQIEAVRVAVRRKRRRYLMFLIPSFSLALLVAMLLRWPNEIGSGLQTGRVNQESTSHKHPSDPVDQGQQQLLSSLKYIDLPSSAALPEPIETTVIQVVLKKEKLRQFGFSVSAVHSSELTKADFVLGEDGLARSIRLVGSVDGVSVPRMSAMGERF